MTILGKLTSSLLYTSAPISIVTSIIVSVFSFINENDCDFVLNLSNATESNSILLNTICESMDIVQLKQAISVIAFAWSCVIGVMVFLIKSKMTKLNDEVQETSKINVELVTETEQLKEQIETMSRATTTVPTARSYQLDNEFRPPSLHGISNTSNAERELYDAVLVGNNEPYNDSYGDEDRRTSTVGSDYQLSNIGSQGTAYPTPTAF